MRRAAFAAVFSAVAALACVASAHDVGETVAIALPPFPPGDGQKAQAVVAEIDAAIAKDKELAKAVAAPLAKAKDALQRAFGARSAGDTAHTPLLEGLALEWASSASAVLRAATVEKASLNVVERADAAARKVERVRALLGESQARKERAATELERLKAAAGDSKKDAAAAEEARLAAKRPAPKSKPEPKAPKAPKGAAGGD
ncbi:MAG TPA: hypothetical protein VGM56_07330 [Byssovorax sp.]